MEGFVIFWRPIVVLGLCRELSLLVAQVGTNHVDLDERPEHTCVGPLELIAGHDCNGFQSVPINSNRCLTYF